MTAIVRGSQLGRYLLPLKVDKRTMRWDTGRRERKVLTVYYTENGELKQRTFPDGSFAKLGFYPKQPEVGSKEWIELYLDRTGAAVRAGGICGWCSSPLTFVPEVPDRLFCRKCKKEISDKTFPETGSQIFDGMKAEYHKVGEGRNSFHYYWKPILRFSKCRYAADQVAAQLARQGDQVSARKSLDIMMSFADYYKKHILSANNRMKLYRAGWPGRCNWGRLTHFGDYCYASGYASRFQQILNTGLKVTEAERVRYRSLLESIITEIELPFVRQSAGMGNPMGACYRDFITTGKVFPEGRFYDLYDRDSAGKPRLLSGTDLVHEAIDGKHGIYNLLANYFYSDGLMHEPAVAYQGMLIAGLRSVVGVLDGYSDPAGYDAASRGYEPMKTIQIKEFLNRPYIQKIFTGHIKVNFPDGKAIPFGDSPSRLMTRMPEKGAVFYPGFMIGSFRMPENKPLSALAMNCNARGGHSPNDQLNLLFWGSGMLLVNTTEYPEYTGRNARNSYWREQSAAHNTMTIDGLNHQRARGKIVFFTATPTVSAMQGLARKCYADGELRRTVFLIDPQNGKPPYMVDLFHGKGGRTAHDIMFQAQSVINTPKESFEVKSPVLSRTVQENLAEALPYAKKNTAYPMDQKRSIGSSAGKCGSALDDAVRKRSGFSARHSNSPVGKRHAAVRRCFRRPLQQR